MSRLPLSAVIATFSVSWGKLTDNDLTAINGSREQLEGKIQQRYGIWRDSIPARSPLTLAAGSIPYLRQSNCLSRGSS
jgi:CsbD-like